jgi:hypothetical protein
MSIIPLIPFLGFIPLLVGFLYYIRNSLTKNNLIISFTSAIIIAFIVFSFGDLFTHFFAIILIPLIILGGLSINKIQQNLLFLLILPVIYSLVFSIAVGYRAEHYFAMWLFVPILTSYFFIECLPKLFEKIRKPNSVNYINKNSKKYLIPTLLITIILITNIGFSYQTLEMYLFEEEFTTINDEIDELFDGNIKQKKHTEIKSIGKFLSSQPNIENSYIMASSLVYAEHANSKYIYVEFNEGNLYDDLSLYITRENWSDYSLWFSNISSFPPDRHNIIHPIPDYVVFDPQTLKGSVSKILPHSEKQFNFYTSILANPADTRIPENWSVIYNSENNGTVIYKIER